MSQLSFSRPFAPEYFGCFPAWPHHGFHLGKPGLGVLLELGSQRELGFDHLAGIRHLPACPHHPRLERKEVSLFFNRGICRRDVHLPGCYLSVAGNARLRELTGEARGNQHAAFVSKPWQQTLKEQHARLSMLGKSRYTTPPWRERVRRAVLKHARPVTGDLGAMRTPCS